MSNATFQAYNGVRTNLGFGVFGEQYDSSPWCADPYSIQSFTASSADNSANNIFGRAFSLYEPGGDNTACVGNPNGTYVYAGILVCPKNYALRGDGTQPLNPSIQVPNGTIGQFCTQGRVIVQLANSAIPGQLIVFANDTGVLYAIDPDAPIPANRSPAYAKTVRYTFAAAPNIGVIELDPTIVYVPAE